MPFSENPSEVTVRGDQVLVRGNQIIVWVTLTLQHIDIPNPSAVPFPAILDTGHSHSFSLNERHLVDWAGLRPEALRALSAVRDRGQRLSLRAANFWVHPNESGRRDLQSGESPSLVETPTGIAVFPGAEFPRLPLFGLRAIAENGLVLKVDGKRREATLRTSRRWWVIS